VPVAEETKLVRQYEAGYRRRPESRAEIDAALVTAVALLRDDEEWRRVPRDALRARAGLRPPAS